jgi:hypothetical protein
MTTSAWVLLMMSHAAVIALQFKFGGVAHGVGSHEPCINGCLRTAIQLNYM